MIDTPEFKCVTDWSTDRRFLLYTSQSGTTNDIRVLELGGTRRVLPVAVSSFNEIAGQFSPDGQWIAYISDESGRFEVYVKAFSPSGDETGGKCQVSSAGGRAPRWRADGRELFYLSLDGRKVMAIDVSIASQKIDAGAPRELFSRTGRPEARQLVDVDVPKAHRSSARKEAESGRTRSKLPLGVVEQNENSYPSRRVGGLSSTPAITGFCWRKVT